VDLASSTLPSLLTNQPAFSLSSTAITWALTTQPADFWLARPTCSKYKHEIHMDFLFTPT